jgi:mRNA interferase RelE/StbE
MSPNRRWKPLSKVFEVAWRIFYHPDVENDFRALGRTDARNIQRVIEERLEKGEPEKTGKALSGDLAGYRRLRTGQTRIVYRVDGRRIEVLIIAVGMRRDDEVYLKVQKRVRRE